MSIFKVQPWTNYYLHVSTPFNENFTVKIVQDIQFGVLSSKDGALQFEYYNGSLESITVLCSVKDPHIVIMKKPTKIKQIFMNDVFKATFMKEMVESHDLSDYHDDYAPTIIYGMYQAIELDILKRNKSLKVIVWAGGDINHKNNTKTKALILKTIRCMDKVRMIAISPFIEKSLQVYKLSYQFTPFMGINFSLYRPVPKGPCIYLYTAPASALNEQIYGKDLYEQLIAKYTNYRFIVTCCQFYYKKINDAYPNVMGAQFYDKHTLVNTIYPQCFIGLRLTEHDGLAATVQELGLMGIKCVHNGASPSSLNYTCFDDICHHIDTQASTIGTIDVTTSQAVKQYLNIDPSFFDA